jgi:Flp pilus assembly protein TadD
MRPVHSHSFHAVEAPKLRDPLSRFAESIGNFTTLPSVCGPSSLVQPMPNDIACNAASAVADERLERKWFDHAEDATFIEFQEFSQFEWHAISYLRHDAASVYFAHDLLLDTDVEPTARRQEVMSRTLTLIGAGWESILSSVAHGRRIDVLKRLRTLIARNDLPTEVASEANRLAGELSLEAERFANAKRYLRTAARISPTDAKTFYLLGLAHERDPHGSDILATRMFRKATRLDPKDPNFRVAFGRAAVRTARSKRGVREILEAAALAPGDIGVIRVAVSGLLEAGRFDDAAAVLNRAKFLCYESAAIREIGNLFQRLRFETARCIQRENTRQRLDADFATEGGRVVLPFVRIANPIEAAEDCSANCSRSVRSDVLSIPRPHVPRLRMRRADR